VPDIVTTSSFGIIHPDIVKADEYFNKFQKKLIDNNFIYAGKTDEGDERWMKNEYFAQLPKPSTSGPKGYYSVGLFFKLFSSDFIKFENYFDINFTEFIDKNSYLLGSILSPLKDKNDDGYFNICKGFINIGETFIELYANVDNKYKINEILFFLVTDRVNVADNFYDMITSSLNNGIRAESYDSNFWYMKYNKYNIKCNRADVIADTLKSWGICLIKLYISL
jgi:hypothetical protein